MISALKVFSEKGKWYINGSSETFDTREEALRRAMSKKKVHNKVKGKKYVSQKLNMIFRSNWEIELAELMDELGIKFLYEPERFYFHREHESYLPDFYLPDYNCWIEVKGWMDRRSERRCKLFKKYHGKETAFFLYEKEERELILKNPELIYTYIDIAIKQYERENNNG